MTRAVVFTVACVLAAACLGGAIDTVTAGEYPYAAGFLIATLFFAAMAAAIVADILEKLP